MIAALLARTTPVESGIAMGLLGLNGSALLVPAALVLILGALLLVAYGMSRLGSAGRRSDAAWYCGYAREAESHRYSAHSFYGEIKRYFGWLGGGAKPRPEKTSKLQDPEATRHSAPMPGGLK